MMRIYPQIDADSKPVEFDWFGVIHNSKSITHNSPQALEVLDYGE